jgi:hypothetical protein
VPRLTNRTYKCATRGRARAERGSRARQEARRAEGAGGCRGARTARAAEPVPPRGAAGYGGPTPSANAARAAVVPAARQAAGAPHPLNVWGSQKGTFLSQLAAQQFDHDCCTGYWWKAFIA